MAKSMSGGGNNKISFGAKRLGKAKKKFGPKENKPKAYKGQGR